MVTTSEIVDRHCKETELIYAALYEEMVQHLNQVKHSKYSGVWLRSAVRSVFAFIEGVSLSLQRNLIFLDMVRKDGNDKDNFQDMDIFLDLYRIPSGKGKKRRRLSFAESVKKSLTLLARRCKVDFTLDVQSQSWQDFLTAIEIRHRVTHPKEPKDLIITPKEMALVANAATWFINAFSEITERRKVGKAANN